VREKPEYAKAKLHLADPTNLDLWPKTAAEVKAIEVVKSQRRYTEWKRRDAEKRREKTAQYQMSKGETK
jgi:hypothetical protein